MSFKLFSKALSTMLRNGVGVKIMRLEARAERESQHTEDECYVSEQMLEMGFEMLDDNGDVYACTLGQVLALLRSRGGDVERLKWDEVTSGIGPLIPLVDVTLPEGDFSYEFKMPITHPNVKISRHNVAVDQDYFWNYDMKACPEAKVQLLTKSGMPHYGKQNEAPGFFVAWAPLPKTRPQGV